MIKLFVIERPSCFTEVTTLYYYGGNLVGECLTKCTTVIIIIINDNYVVLPMVVSTTVYRVHLEFMCNICNRFFDSHVENGIKKQKI